MYGRLGIHRTYLYCTPLVKALDTTKANETATICDITFLAAPIRISTSRAQNFLTSRK
jgi:hypothetical protein